MKNLNKYISSLAVFLACVSCGDNDEYVPAAEPAAADNYVYFDASNKSEYLREDDSEEEPVIYINLRREKSDGELVVPLEHSQVVGDIDAPTSVTFLAGESEKTIKITYTGFPQMVLTIPDNFSNPYKEKEGFYKQLIAVKKIVTVTKPFKLYNDDWTTENMFSKSESLIKWIVGENKFVYTNFFGSGIDLVFRIDTDHGGKYAVTGENNLTACGGPIDPLSNAIVNTEIDGDNSWGGWSLTYDYKPNANSVDAAWTPQGAETGVTEYIYFYTFSGDPSDKSNYGYNALYLYEKDYNSGYTSFSGVVIDDETGSNYLGRIYLLDEYSK